MINNEITTPSEKHIYKNLLEEVSIRGYLKKKPWYYVRKFIESVAIITTGTLLVIVSQGLVEVFVVGIMYSFAFTQIAFIVHDAGHYQILHKSRHNDVLGLILCNLILGLSYGWWVEKHNNHHKNPNHVDLDPDLEIPFMVFTEEDIEKKRGIELLLVKYQSYLFFPLLSLSSFSLRKQSVEFLIKKKTRFRRFEILLISSHIVIYVFILTQAFSIVNMLVFVAVHQLGFGLYLGLVFATNHKGMAIINEACKLGLLRKQLMTTRNIVAHSVTDYIFGPLGPQIEHHLFPTMPRKYLRKAGDIVKSFCREYSLPYHEVSLVRAYKEVVTYLSQVSQSIN